MAKTNIAPEAISPLDAFLDKVHRVCVELNATLDRLDAENAQHDEPGLDPHSPTFEVIDDGSEDLPFPEEKKDAPKITVDDLRNKAVKLIAAGKKEEVRKVVKAYAERVTEISPEDFEAAMKDLVALEG